MADIAINPVSRRVQFTGNTGTGPFAFTFNILADEDIVVYKNTTLLTLTTDYTVSTNADGTGSVTLVAALVSSDVLTIIGGRELERTTDFVTAGDLLAESLNEQLDSLVIMAQQLDEKMTRSFKVNPGDVFTDLEMPLLDDRKGKFLQFNSTTGDPEAGPSNTALSNIADYLTEIDTVGDDLNAGSYVAGGEYDFGSITDASVGSTGSPDGFIVTVYNNLANIAAVSGISSNVATVASISANVTTVASNDANITTVAGNISNVNSVAGNATNINAVASNATNINAVAADATDIGTVATNIANVNTVGGISANVTTVAGISSDVTAVAADATDIGTVAGLSTEIGALGAITSDITAVNSNSANINTVAGNNTNITTVAGISANVTTVAGISSDITSVAADATDIGTVAGDSANIQALGPISADITTVAGISANVTTVAGISANTTTVAGISSDVTTVAGISANTTTVAGISSDVTTVAGISSNVTTVANNVTGINSFAEKYRVGTSDPATSLDTGDLFYNTTSNTLKVYNGSAWEAGVTAGSGFMPLSGGTFTGAVTFAAGQTFDGRDVSADGTKLDGIEANADVTDAANVEPLIDAHINVSGATSGQYLGWNGTDYAWSTVDLSTKLDLSGGTMTGAITFAAGQTFDGRDVSADGTKLDGIEAGADVTDATNVQAAGALMDSEISSLASVKAINQGLSTTSSPTFSTVTAANFNTTSDATLKTNVETLTGSLDAVKALRGVSYDWIESGDSDIGVIAQEVEAVVPDVVSTNDQGIKSVKYGNLVGVLIEAIKEQQQRIEALEAKLGG